jgi:hypothetical protein
MNPTLTVKQHGQQIWLDNLSRTHLREGILARLVDEDGLAGVTSNPAIFFKAISESPYYCEDVTRFCSSHRSAEECYEELVLEDVRQACDVLLCTYRETGGSAGYVSLEVWPMTRRKPLPKHVASVQRLDEKTCSSRYLRQRPEFGLSSVWWQKGSTSTSP